MRGCEKNNGGEGNMKSKKPTKKRGRPETRIIKLDATPEEAARALFSAVKPPDPTLRRKARQPRLG